MASYIDLHVRRDKDYVWDGVASVQKGRASTALGLSDAELTLTVRDRKGGNVLLVKTSDPDTGLVIDADQETNEGAYTLSWFAADTADADVWPEDGPRTYPYELEATTPDGTFLLAYGSVKYSADTS